MRILFKFLPQLFNTLYVTAEADLSSTESIVSPGGASGSDAAGSSPATEASDAITDSTAGSATASDVASGTTQAEDDFLKDIPTEEELQALADQQIPHAKNLQQLRAAYEKQKGEFEPLKSYKSLVEKNLDPDQLTTAYEMVSGLHSPVIDPQTQQPIPDRFTTTPFLERLESDSPGTTDQLFSDLLQLRVQTESGPDTLVRQLVRSWGLDPDRIEDYRTIDARVPSSGFVTPDQLVGIDPKFHEAFKALSPAQREDILAQKQEDNTFPQAAMEYLSDKAEALEARKFREQFAQQETQRQEQAQAKFEQDTQQAVQEDISTVVGTMHDSILQRLSSQVKLSSDETVNEIEHAKIMGSLFSLLDPNLRRATVKALEKAGTPLDPKFDDLVSALEAERTNVVRYTRYSDKLRAGSAQSRANLIQSQLLAKLENYAMALAQPSANRLQADSQNLANTLNGATARHVPNGHIAPQGNANPYDLPAGIQPFTEEARAHRAQVDRQLRN